MASIYSLLIILFAAGFYAIIRSHTGDVTAMVLDSDRAVAESLVRSVSFPQKTDPRGKDAGSTGLRSAIEQAMQANPLLLGAVIYSPTEDENYFEVKDIVSSGTMKDLPLEMHTIVKESKRMNFLRKALVSITVDSVLYKDDKTAVTWQNAYVPTNPGKKGNNVVQYFISAEKTRRTVAAYENSLMLYAAGIFGLAVLMMIAVLVLTMVQAHNFTLLINNLSSYMSKAARGDLEVNLNSDSDVELSELALSFNSLIDELKDKSHRLAQEPPQLKEIFAIGVTMLKDNRLDEAVGVFNALLSVNPDKFGTCFNLGVAYAKKGENMKSLDMFQKAYEINPTFEKTTAYIDKIKIRLERDAAPH